MLSPCPRFIRIRKSTKSDPEDWSRFNAGEDGDPFQKNKVVGIINTEDPSIDFEWTDNTQVAFTITMQDEDNSYWEVPTLTPFCIDTIDSSYPVLSYLNDKWDLYRAFVISNDTIIVQDWTRFNAGENGDSFRREHDVCAIPINEGTCGFKWTDGSHVAFTVKMIDKSNSNWDEEQEVTFTVETENANAAKIGADAKQKETTLTTSNQATPIPHETVEATPAPTITPTEEPTESPAEDANDLITVEPIREVIDLSEYSDEDLLAINVQVQAEIANRYLEKTASVTPGKYLVGSDIPAGKYILKNTSGDTVYIAIFKDNKQSYKDSEALDRFNFYADRETSITLEEGTVFEVRHHTIDVTITKGIVFQ